MKNRDEQSILRRRQSDLTDTPEHQHAPPTEGKRIHIGKVVRDDRFWPYTNRDIVLGGVVHVPGPPYVAMTAPLEYPPFDAGDTPTPVTLDGDPLIPVLSLNEAPLNDTLIIARNADGRWVTDDAFGGYFRPGIVAWCQDVITDGAEITVENLSSPFETHSATWTYDPSATNYSIQAILFDPIPTGGTFTAHQGTNPFGPPPTWTTAPIPYNATASDVESAFAAVGVTVTCLDGPLPGKAIIVKTGPLSGFTVSPTGLLGGRDTIVQVGVGPYVRGGTYRLKQFGTVFTEDIPFDASMEQFQAIVERSPWIGPGNVRVTDSVPGLAYGRYLCEFINLRGNRAFTPFTDVDIANLTGPDPSVVIRTVQAGQGVVPTQAGTSPGILYPGSTFTEAVNSPVFPYRTRGPFRFTIHSPVGDWPDVTEDLLPPAGLFRPSFTVGEIVGKICSCFGRVHPAFTVSAPFGTLDLTPQYDAGTGEFLDTWIFDGAVTVTGYTACIDTLEAVTVIGNTTSSGSTRIRITFTCGSPPNLTIQFLIGPAVVYSTTVWQFVNHSNWQTDYCPSTTLHCTFTSATIGCYPTVPDLPLSHYMDTSFDGIHSGGIAYSGSLPVALPVIASFTVGSVATKIGTPLGVSPIPFSGIAGTWTVSES